MRVECDRMGRGMRRRGIVAMYGKQVRSIMGWGNKGT
jgi:hypothetical protein